MAAKAFNIFICIFLQLLLHFYESRATSTSSFEFLKGLQGFRKGDKIEGLHELKRYLQNFGYLNYKNIGSNIDDTFDDQLESAVKIYQLNFNLNATTGVLDAATVSTMMMPRCGVPDIINGTTRVRSNLLHNIGPQYKFLPGKPKWSYFDLAYAFAPGTRGDAFAPIGRAFDSWASSSTNFAFKLNEIFNRAELQFTFQVMDHRGGVLAEAYPPIYGTCHVDSEESWSMGPDPPGPTSFDMQTVALHEIGHLLGLGHSSEEDAVMFPTLPPGTTKTLQYDDIAGLFYLYND